MCDRTDPITGVDVGAEAVVHMNHAQHKHPWPRPVVFTRVSREEVDDILRRCRQRLAEESDMSDGQAVTTVLQCEVAEFFVACMAGDRDAAFHELMDVTGAGLRLINGDGDFQWVRNTAVRIGGKIRRPRFPEDDE